VIKRNPSRGCRTRCRGCGRTVDWPHPRRLSELLRLSLDHLFEGETETAGGGGARQFFRRYVGRRSGNRRRHCHGLWLQFWEPPEISAHHTRAESGLGRHRRNKRPTQPSRGKILAVRQRSCVTCSTIKGVTYAAARIWKSAKESDFEREHSRFERRCSVVRDLQYLFPRPFDEVDRALKDLHRCIHERNAFDTATSEGSCIFLPLFVCGSS